VKLLIDQNLSFHICDNLQNVFPHIKHVKDESLESASDEEIWEYAINNSYIIVTKDSDFSEKAIAKDFPPKVIWIKRGNCTTKNIEDLFNKIKFVNFVLFYRLFNIILHC
jgi:predicted nuclease of predicted toxin-antitoxin system